MKDNSVRMCAFCWKHIHGHEKIVTNSYNVSAHSRHGDSLIKSGFFADPLQIITAGVNAR